MHDGLRDMQLDFRIIKDTQKLGRFAKLEDIEKINDLYSNKPYFTNLPPTIQMVFTWHNTILLKRIIT